jgi:hypothetical protein
MIIEDRIKGNGLNSPQVKASLKNQKVGNKRGIGATLYLVLEALSMTAAGGFFAYQVLKGPVSEVIEEQKLRQVCNQAETQYGDTDKNRFVSPAEEQEIFQNVFYKKGITFNPDTLEGRYSNGKEVPAKELTKIIRNYIEHPFPSR